MLARTLDPAGKHIAEILLKREDLCHTGAHKINNALGQVLLATKMGKRRIIAETGAGQHGVATATAAALFGRPCEVYQGALDVERQAPNVARMKLLGARVIPVESGSRTLKDALSEALRDWVTNVRDTYYCVGSVAGPHPYPMLVADLQRIIGDEARAQCRTLGGTPDAVVACVGGGSNAMGIFKAFDQEEPDTALYGVEAAGHGLDTGEHAATLTRGRVGVLHGARSYVLCDDAGQILEAHSVSAGLDYPGVGPEHAWLHDTGRAVYLTATDDGGARRRAPGGAHRGHPGGAGDGARVRRDPRGGAPRVREARAAGADPGQRLGARRQGPGDRARQARRPTGGETMSRIESTFALLRASGKKALCAYLCMGDPSLAESIELAVAAAGAGADLLELGVPFSDPTADGPVIARAAMRAIHAGSTLAGVIDAAAAIRARTEVPLVLFTYYNPVLVTGEALVVERAKKAGIDALLLVDLLPEEGAELRAAAAAAGIAFVPLVAPTSDAARADVIVGAAQRVPGTAAGLPLLRVHDRRDRGRRCRLRGRPRPRGCAAQAVGVAGGGGVRHRRGRRRRASRGGKVG